MSFEKEFVFMSGLDKSYGSNKRALVRRGIQRGEPSQRMGSMGIFARAPPAQNPLPADEIPAGDSEDDQIIEWACHRSRLVANSVDNVPQVLDPFNSAAHPPDELAQRLCRHYVISGDWLFQGAHPHAVVFGKTKHDKAAVVVMQAYAAYDLARLGACDSRLALTKRVESISLINEALKDPSAAYQDSIIGAILGTIAIDVQPASAAIRAQHKVEAKVHVAGVTRLLALRGGLSQLPHWLQCFYYWIDVQLCGALSKIWHEIASSATSAAAGVADGAQRSFETVASETLVTTYTRAYNAAVHRLEFSPSLSELFEPGTGFHSLLSKGGADRPSVRVAVLLYCNHLVVDNGFGSDAIWRQMTRSSMLVQLLRSGKGTTEGLLFALLMREEEDGSHAVHDITKVTALASCMYTYNRMTWFLKLHLETALMGLLLADNYGVDTLWTPERFEEVLGGDAGAGSVVQEVEEA